MKYKTLLTLIVLLCFACRSKQKHCCCPVNVAGPLPKGDTIYVDNMGNDYASYCCDEKGNLIVTNATKYKGPYDTFPSWRYKKGRNGVDTIKYPVTDYDQGVIDDSPVHGSPPIIFDKEMVDGTTQGRPMTKEEVIRFHEEMDRIRYDDSINGRITYTRK
jgi:hypothetical protein